MVIVSHNRAMMEQIVDRTIFLEEGEIEKIENNPSKELTEAPFNAAWWF
jgi:ABC-type polysaccharide/polyol phosphate transport system ATPase subunit